MKVGFIGLGVMGFPMASHLVKAGHDVTVYNRNSDKAKRWQALEENVKASIADTPALLAKNCDFVFSCVGNDQDVEAIALGEQGAFQSMKPGSIFVDHTTTSAVVAKKLAAAAKQQGFQFLDAPLSGGQSGAEKGILSIMVGGDQDAFENARNVMTAYGRTIQLIGPTGSGQQCKMVNQICIAGLVQGLAEAIYFGKAVGLDMEKVMSVISGGAAQSWQMQNRYKTMMEGKYEFGFAVDWMRKDLSILLKEAHAKGIELPVTEIIDGYYADVQKMGGGRWDTSSLLARLDDK